MISSVTLVMSRDPFACAALLCPNRKMGRVVPDLRDLRIHQRHSSVGVFANPHCLPLRRSESKLPNRQSLDACVGQRALTFCVTGRNDRQAIGNAILDVYATDLQTGYAPTIQTDLQ